MAASYRAGLHLSPRRSCPSPDQWPLQSSSILLLACPEVPACRCMSSGFSCIVHLFQLLHVLLFQCPLESQAAGAYQGLCSANYARFQISLDGQGVQEDGSGCPCLSAALIALQAGPQLFSIPLYRHPGILRSARDLPLQVAADPCCLAPVRSVCRIFHVFHRLHSKVSHPRGPKHGL